MTVMTGITVMTGLTRKTVMTMMISTTGILVLG